MRGAESIRALAMRNGRSLENARRLVLREMGGNELSKLIGAAVRAGRGLQRERGSAARSIDSARTASKIPFGRMSIGKVENA
jgi:hypothetical protein